MKSKLVKCKSCGADIAKSAKACPGCGAKQRRSKALGVVLVAFGVILIVGALGGGDDKQAQKVGASNPPSAQQSSSQPQTPTSFEVGDSVALNDITVTLVNVTESKGANYASPADGKVFIICEFEIENNSKKDIAVSSLMSFEAYVDDYSTSINLSATVSADKPQLDGSVAAGKKMNGIIGYEADAGWKNLEVRFTPDFWSGKDIIFVAIH